MDTLTTPLSPFIPPFLPLLPVPLRPQHHRFEINTLNHIQQPTIPPRRSKTRVRSDGRHDFWQVGGEGIDVDGRVEGESRIEVDTLQGGRVRGVRPWECKSGLVAGRWVVRTERRESGGVACHGALQGVLVDDLRVG